MEMQNIKLKGGKRKMSFKEKLQERIAKNATKIPNISWTDNSGKVYTEDIILKRSKFPLIGDWARIYPPIDEDGKINWINAVFGGKKNFIRTIIFLGVVGLFLLGYYEVFSSFEAYKQSCIQIIIP